MDGRRRHSICCKLRHAADQPATHLLTAAIAAALPAVVVVLRRCLLWC